MKRIYSSTNRDRYVLVDDEDYEKVKGYRWWIDPVGRASASIWVNGGVETLRLYRLIMNAPKGSSVDHVNGNVRDNRKSNLRVCTSQQNRWNTKISTKPNGYKGVYKTARKNGFMASITVNYKTKYIGLYKTAMEAAYAYDEVARRVFGEYASTNFS